MPRAPINESGDKTHRPASITQVLDRIGVSKTFIDELVAANDSGYIPAMERVFEEHKERLVGIYGEDGYERKKSLVIAKIRAIDRKSQGVDNEMEKEAELAIRDMKQLENGVSLVRFGAHTFSPVRDRLFMMMKEGEITSNVIIVCNCDEENKDVYYFGRGDVCEQVVNDPFWEKFFGNDKKNHVKGVGEGYGNSEKEAIVYIGINNEDIAINIIVSKNA